MASALRYLLFFFIVIFSPSPTIAQSSTKISLGSSLTARSNANSSWPSPSGEFAFGFRQMGKNEFLLAIWFNKIQERTIVWSANGNNLAAQGSKVELTSDGQFVLNDATGKQLWNAAESAITGVDHAAMLDTGNFILANRNSTTLWGSFDQPTDTILPTQTLNQNNRLFARYSASNYSTGRFLFTLQADGNLVLYTTNFPQNSTNYAYWSPNIDSGFQVIFNQSGNIYVTSMNGTILSTILSETITMQDFYQRATLEYDGVLRHYVYPKSSSSSAGRWPLAWSAFSFIPPNICTSFSEAVGSGACGYNSLCRLDDDEQSPTCLCPKGYSFVDPNDVLKGCKQDFLLQSCDEASPEAALFEIQDIQHANWVGADYEIFHGVPEDWCRQNCLEDCFCYVAYFNNGRCFKKRLPVSNGNIGPKNTGKALLKIGKVNSTDKSAGRAKTEKKDNSTLILVGSLLLGSSVVLNFLLPLLSYLLIYPRKFMKIRPYSVMPGMTLRYFSYEELKKVTNEFKEEIGRGASATVFKGVLASDEEKHVAVKRLDTNVGENDSEFKAEVSAIGRTNHRNLVHLVGFCKEGQHRILVYEFMSNGSLASLLFGESKPNWYQRRQVALGIARGLLYLHEECSNQIVHCDIKPQNILLDDNFSARIADFGLAKLFRLDQTRTMTAIRGTKGYVAPEWFKSLPITVKVDVYSCGILLLEIIFCREHFKATVEDENEMILVDWAYDCYRKKELHLLFKTDDDAMNDIKKMEKYVMIAIWCIQEDPTLRPTMKKVTLMLEGTIEVSAPPDPYSFISSII